MDFDTAVKLNIYETLAASTHAPTSRQVAAALEASPHDVEAAFDRLHQKRLLVPEPGNPARIRMAPPFSGVPTAFPVQVGEKRYFANCVWDALGVAAALREDARVDAVDGHSGDPIQLRVRGGRPVPQACVIHFAVPAARWWEDIVYT
jgi:DNA-binding transcriptional MocR family regulator